MHWTVIVEVGDSQILAGTYRDRNIVDFRIETHSTERRISHGNSPDDTWTLLDRQNIEASPNAAVDLLRFAVAVYTIDCRLPRKEARDGWSRAIDLHLPVLEVERWLAAREIVEKLLRFITGDIWAVHFHPGQAERPESNGRLRNTFPLLEATAVCLLSGGLDSFIGAADALADGHKLYLVSHNQGKYTRDVQKTVADALRRRFGEENIQHIQACVHPPSTNVLKNLAAPTGSELSMRSRSLLFFAYGALVATSLDGNQPLLVPENGLITINPPLVASRAGSHSTRTTHPHTLGLFRDLLETIELDLEMRLDYRFRTKGEMLKGAIERQWVCTNALKTMSCGKPNWVEMESRRRELGALRQCGGCVPCIIRRAALHEADITGERYLLPNLDSRPSEDSRAFGIALERLKQRGDLLPQVLETGPIQPGEIVQYLDVVHRGFDEVAQVI